LDVSKNTRLTYLNCSSNKLSAGALNALFEMLLTVSKGIDVNLYIKNNPGTEDCDISIAKNKGWTIDLDIP